MEWILFCENSWGLFLQKSSVVIARLGSNYAYQSYLNSETKTKMCQQIRIVFKNLHLLVNKSWQIIFRYHICFPLNFAKLLRKPILKKICERISLNLEMISPIFQSFSRCSSGRRSCKTRLAYTKNRSCSWNSHKRLKKWSSYT